MNKVIIIGHPEIAARIVGSVIDNENVVIVENEEDLSKILGTDASCMFPKKTEPFIIASLPRLTEMVYPKLKHLPKGHQRPYKYHR